MSTMVCESCCNEVVGEYDEEWETTDFPEFCPHCKEELYPTQSSGDDDDPLYFITREF